jgi:hypothetical protein
MKRRRTIVSSVRFVKPLNERRIRAGPLRSGAAGGHPTAAAEYETSANCSRVTAPMGQASKVVGALGVGHHWDSWHRTL